VTEPDRRWPAEEELRRNTRAERIAATLSSIRRRCSGPRGTVALAVTTTGIALLIRFAEQATSPRLGIFHLAVAVSAMFGGLFAGLLTITLSTCVVLVWFYPRVDGSISIVGADLYSLLFFIVTGIVISGASDLDRLLHERIRRRARADLAHADARVRSVIRAMREGVLVFSPEGRLTFSNPAADALLGLSGPDLAVEHDELVAPVLLDEDGNRLAFADLPGRHVLDTGLSSRDTIVGVKSGETVVWLLVNAEPIPDPETGAPNGAVATLADYTERRRAERELLESRARLDQIVSFAEDAIVTVDENLSVVLFNRAAERMFGLSREEALGRPLHALLPECGEPRPADAGGAAPPILEIGRETIARRRDGGEFPVEVSCSPTGDRLRPLHTVILRDATERRRADVTNARLAAIVASSPAAIVAFDRDERISAWNPAAETMFGYTAAEALGAPATLIAFPADVDSVRFNVRSTLAGATFGGDATRRRKDGTPVEVALYGAPVRHPDGAVIGASVMFFDIGARRRTERLLREREDEQRHTLAAAGLGIWWIEEPTGLVYCDRRSAALFGTSENPTVAELARRFAPDTLPAYFSPDLARDPIDPEPVIVPITRPDGTTTWLSLTARRRVTADGHHEIWGTVRDVGAQVLAERAVKQIEATRRLEALGRMTGGIAHDFNNLLTVVSGNLQLLEMQPLEATCRRRIGEALRATESGTSLVQRLSTFARQRRLEPAVVDLNTRITATMDLAARSLGAAISLTPAFADDLWPVRLDIGEFESALLNLVFNARDAMPDGGTVVIETRNVEVERSGMPADGAAIPGAFVRLSVSDNGVGMTPEVQARAFEPFFTTKEVGRGTGLGLSTLHGFVHQSGGFVTLYSEPGHGTTVNVYLPRVIGLPGTETPRVTPPMRRGRGERILVVEDHPHVADVTRERLVALGYRVIEAATAPQALSLIEAGEPVDLVFSDIVMPGGMSGLDLARRLRRERPELRVLLTSGFAEDLIRATDPASEPWVVLRKPYLQTDLARAIGEALGDRVVDDDEAGIA
jgi:PAS domain S-box-containing protein